MNETESDGMNRYTTDPAYAWPKPDICARCGEEREDHGDLCRECDGDYGYCDHVGPRSNHTRCADGGEFEER